MSGDQLLSNMGLSCAGEMRSWQMSSLSKFCITSWSVLLMVIRSLYRGWHGSFLHCCGSIIDSLSTVGVHCIAHPYSSVLHTLFLWILHTATPILLGTDDSAETVLCPRLWASYTCHNKCDVSEGDFHNHCQNLMIAVSVVTLLISVESTVLKY